MHLKIIRKILDQKSRNGNRNWMSFGKEKRVILLNKFNIILNTRKVKIY
jgi:hypothetical protein